MTLTESTDDQFMALAGIRYCLSRQSYASGIGQQALVSFNSQLTDNNRNTIICDVIEALMDETAGSPVIDAPGWRQAADRVWVTMDEADREWVRDAVAHKRRRWPLDQG